MNYPLFTLITPLVGPQEQVLCGRNKTAWIRHASVLYLIRELEHLMACLAKCHVWSKAGAAPYISCFAWNLTVRDINIIKPLVGSQMIVIVMSLSFVGFVTILHIIGKVSKVVWMMGVNNLLSDPPAPLPSAPTYDMYSNKLCSLITLTCKLLSWVIWRLLTCLCRRSVAHRGRASYIIAIGVWCVVGGPKVFMLCLHFLQWLSLARTLHAVDPLPLAHSLYSLHAAFHMYEHRRQHWYRSNNILSSSWCLACKYVYRSPSRLG